MLKIFLKILDKHQESIQFSLLTLPSVMVKMQGHQIAQGILLQFYSYVNLNMEKILSRFKEVNLLIKKFFLNFKFYQIKKKLLCFISWVKK